MYRIEYCAEKMRYKGLCDLHPLYCVYGDSAEDAMMKIILLVAGLDLDNETTDVDIPLGLEDTQEVTNVCWPPVPPLPKVPR